MKRTRAQQPGDAATAALTRVLEPLVDLLLDFGYTSTRAEQVLRDVFVATAQRKYAAERKRVPVSLVALHTGLYRQDVRRRLARLKAAPGAAPEGSHPLQRILDGWHGDPAYRTRSGTPRVLPKTGTRSFASLVAKYAPQTYPALVLAELERSGAVRRDARGRLSVAAGASVGLEATAGGLESLGDQARGILTTLVAHARDRHAAPVAVVGKTYRIDPRYETVVRNALRARAQLFMQLVEIGRAHV